VYAKTPQRVHNNPRKTLVRVFSLLTQYRPSICMSSRSGAPSRKSLKDRTKSLSMLSRSKQPYTFKNVGMFLNALTFRNQRNPFTYKFLFKKKIFSFLYPNEVRNALMNRKKRITLYKLVFNFKKRLKMKPRFNMSSFNKLVLNQYKVSLQNQLSSDKFS